MQGAAIGQGAAWNMADFLLELYHDAAEYSPSELRIRVLRRLQDIVPFDFAVWGGGQAEGRLVNDLSVLDQSHAILGEWEAVAHQDGFCDLTLEKLGTTARFDDVPGYRESLAYNEHWRRFDASHMMATIVAERSDGYVSFVGLCADDRPRAFSDAERGLKQVLMPHFSQALRISRDLGQARGDLPCEAMGLVDPDGAVISVEGPFVELAMQEWGPGSGGLPADVVQALHREGRWGGVALQAKMVPFGRNYFVHLVATPALERLSPREREVARLFGSGLTHKAVARRLGSSPSTVRNQLARVYEKLGVSNKTELAALVGRDNR